MRVVLFVFAKNEELYIEDFMIYYYNLGIDYIYILDNNDNDKEPSLRDFLNNSQKIKDYRHKYLIEHEEYQRKSYQNCYKNHKDEFDWFLVVDIDEFLDLNGYCNNIKELLLKHKDNEMISFKWVTYGDNELIERDMSKPVYEVFTKKANFMFENNHKTIFNKSKIDKYVEQYGIDNINFNHVLITHKEHKIFFYKKSLLISNTLESNSILENRPFIRHIRTYSLKEYLDQKYRIKYFSLTNINKGDIRRYLLSLYYFKINQWTPEKQQYIEEYRKKNNIIRTLCIFKSFEQFNKYSKKFNNICVYICGKHFENIVFKENYIFQGINSLKTIIYDFDNIVFIK